MNWLLAIKRLLGRFWADIFGEHDFILGIEYLQYLYSKLTGYQYLNWRNGLIAADTSVEQDNLPFLIYIDATTIRKEWYTWDKLWDDNSAKKFLDNKFYTDEAEEAAGWVAYSKDPIQDPFYMTDHIYHYSKMLIEGLDYDFYNGKFIFHVDPSTLGFKTVKMTDRDGLPHVYYELFGYMKKEYKICDPVTGFESSWLNPYSDIAWDIHQNGATFYNVKRLLGAASNVVICENEGTVGSVWTEQDYNCLQVGEKVYISKKPLADGIAVGVAVQPGTVLFGKLLMFTGNDVPTAAQIPGIVVTTDVGELIAYNTGMTPDRAGADRVVVLPLRKGAITSGPFAPYLNVCAANVRNDKCPYLQVPPAGVNPFVFITQTLRRGRAVTIRLVAELLDVLGAAIECIRKSCCASGMVNIYVEAATDDNDMLKTSGFAADAGMMAVAVVETLTIKEECAKAEITL